MAADKIEFGAVFSEDFLRRLERLNLVSRKPVAGHLRGTHRSRRTGSGMVFTDFRPYSPGDDIRNLDWNTYLRLDRLVLRLFEEEADLPIYVFLDQSRSMAFGTPTKFDYARTMAAGLAYIALLNHDRVHLVGYFEGISNQLPARRGKHQVWQVFGFLKDLDSVGGTDLYQALSRFFGARRTRGLVIVLSEFHNPNGYASAFQVLRQYRHEVFALHLMSREEIAPDLAEEVVLVDSEDGSDMPARITPAMLQAYHAVFETHCRDLESACRKHGWGYMRVPTDLDFETMMLQVLRQEHFVR